MKKTYAELEREAYITGDTELAKLYAAAEDRQDSDDLEREIEELRSDLDEANATLEEIKDLVRYV